ncbi:MAG: KdsC family phosphatase [Candidatus Omnitrophota bacterium]
MHTDFSRIKAVIMDVDGVLTEGKIIYDARGEEIKVFDVKDGYGIAKLRDAGIKTAIISARISAPVEARARGLGIDLVYQDAHPKLSFYEKAKAELNVDDDDICYVGDDIPDIPPMQRAGIAAAVADASAEVKDAADYISRSRGGQGAIREIAEQILKSQGAWDA